MYTYLLIHFFTLLFPLSYSFDQRISFYKKWKFLLPAILLVAAFFVVWDFLFTSWGVWFFDSAYVVGIYFFGLPLEEIMFFLTVPFSCVFIYEAMKYFVKQDYLRKYSKVITLALIITFVALAVIHHSKIYTSITSLFAVCMLIIHCGLFGNRLLGRFYFAYAITLIPFFIVNGILTSIPVVTYNDAENLGLRIGTIPVEDMIYSFLLLLMNITAYEYFKLRYQPGGIKKGMVVANNLNTR